jgi:hypothetical protein
MDGSRQIYGYTPTEYEGEYVKYASVHREADGTVRLSVRNERGELNSIILPVDEVAALRAALA